MFKHLDKKRDTSAEQIRRMLDIKYNNHNLKNARIITTNLFNCTILLIYDIIDLIGDLL